MVNRRIFPKYLKICSMPLKEAVQYAFETDTNETFYTADAQLLSLLRQVLGFKVEMLAPPDRQYGRASSNGSWNGVIGMVQREEADLAVGKLGISEERSTVVDFSYPYQMDPITFVTDKPEYLRNAYAILEPFSTTVWIAIVITLSILLILCCTYKNIKRGRENLTLTVLGILLEETVKLKFQSFAATVLMSFWIFGAMILTYSYKAVLLSSLTFPTATGIQNIAQLAKASEDISFKCSTYPGGMPYATLLRVTHGPMKTITECLTRSDMFNMDMEEFLSSPEYRKAYVGVKSHIGVLRYGFFISEDNFYFSMTGIAVGKSFCCKRDLNKAIHRLAAVGLLQRIRKREIFFGELEKLHLATREADPNAKLSLGDFAGAFVFLLCGYAAGTFILVMEMVLGGKP